MNQTTAAIFRALLRAAHPGWLLAGGLLYAIGAGIAEYLGTRIEWSAYWLGQGAATMFQLSSYLLRDYFDRATQPPFEPIKPPRPRKPAAETGGEPDEPVEVIVPRVVFLQVAAAALTIGAAFVVMLYASGGVAPTAFVFLGLIFLLALAYAVPPLRLVYSGYGELVMAVLMANLFPGLSYLIQVGELHRLLAMLTFPLTFLYLAAALARSLPGYLDDVRHERGTLMVRVGWQRGMLLHNALLSGAYILLAASVFSGLEPRLAYPAFLSLPLAAFQIWQMNSIAGGAKPRWKLLSATSLATLGLTVYFINLALWTG